MIFELPEFTTAAEGVEQSSLAALRDATETSYYRDDEALWVKLVVADAGDAGGPFGPFGHFASGGPGGPGAFALAALPCFLGAQERLNAAAVGERVSFVQARSPAPCEEPAAQQLTGWPTDNDKNR